MTTAFPESTNDPPDNSSAVPLPLPKKRIAIGIALTIAFVLVALLCPIPFKGRAASALGDLVHAPLFGSLALAWLWIWQRIFPLEGTQPPARPHQGRRLVGRGIVVWIVLSGFGAMMELVQSGMGRTMSAHDAVANSLGIAAAIALYTSWWFLTHQRRRSSLLFLLLSLTVLVYAWSSPLRVLWDISVMRNEFPMLCSFESSPQLTRWYFRGFDHRIINSNVSDGQRALLVTYPVTEFAGITLVDMVRDWSGFDHFETDLTLDADHPYDSETLQLQFIQSESAGTKDAEFHAEVKLIRGERVRIQIPLSELKNMTSGKTIDFRSLLYVDLAIKDVTHPTIVTIDRVQLSKAD